MNLEGLGEEIVVALIDSVTLRYRYDDCLNLVKKILCPTGACDDEDTCPTIHASLLRAQR